MAIVSGIASSPSVRLIGQRYAAWFASAAVALYTLFVGASAAAIGCIAVWGTQLGRQNSAPNDLSDAALGMTAWNPHALSESSRS